MCCIMCTLNMAGAYRPIPEDVVTSSSAQAQSQAMVRPTGHESPRACSRRTPSRYSTASTIARVPKIRSKRQSNSILATVGGPARS
ncbi:Uncharacterised protein [Mycobacteroides abscessus subsp. abscessus]|nr:Uncharacterised protein [Mycobacteroides abscessus subsp. abscessus]